MHTVEAALHLQVKHTIKSGLHLLGLRDDLTDRRTFVTMSSYQAIAGQLREHGKRGRHFSLQLALLKDAALETGAYLLFHSTGQDTLLQATLKQDLVALEACLGK